MDTGLRNAVCLTGSPDRGRLMETAVHGALERTDHEGLFYWKDEVEVDFAVRRGLSIRSLIQVAEEGLEKDTPRAPSTLLRTRRSPADLLRWLRQQALLLRPRSPDHRVPQAPLGRNTEYETTFGRIDERARTIGVPLLAADETRMLRASERVLISGQERPVRIRAPELSFAPDVHKLRCAYPQRTICTSYFTL